MEQLGKLLREGRLLEAKRFIMEHRQDEQDFEAMVDCSLHAMVMYKDGYDVALKYARVMKGEIERLKETIEQLEKDLKQANDQLYKQTYDSAGEKIEQQDSAVWGMAERKSTNMLRSFEDAFKRTIFMEGTTQPERYQSDNSFDEAWAAASRDAEESESGYYNGFEMNHQSKSGPCYSEHENDILSWKRDIIDGNRPEGLTLEIVANSKFALILQADEVCELLWPGEGIKKKYDLITWQWVTPKIIKVRLRARSAH